MMLPWKYGRCLNISQDFPSMFPICSQYFPVKDTNIIESPNIFPIFPIFSQYSQYFPNMFPIFSQYFHRHHRRWSKMWPYVTMVFLAKCLTISHPLEAGRASSPRRVVVARWWFRCFETRRNPRSNGAPFWPWESGPKRAKKLWRDLTILWGNSWRYNYYII